MLECLTDNRNRTVPEIRHLFSKHGGNLGENGSVGWLFTRKGLILVAREDDLSEDWLMEQALEAGRRRRSTSKTANISGSSQPLTNSTRSKRPWRRPVSR